MISYLMRNIAAKILIIILMITFSTNAECQRKWHYSMAFGGELKSGNVNTATFRNGGSITRNDSILSLDAGYAIVYGEKDKVVFDKSLTAHLKFDIWQYDRWSPFLSTTYFNNKFKGFDYRLSCLLGAKYRIFCNKKCDYSISLAYVQDYTDYGANTTKTLKAMVSRMSLRFKIKQKIADNVFLKHMTFWQPSLMHPTTSMAEDYVILSTTSISTKISKHLSLDFNFTYEYNSLVPTGIKNTDIITSASFNLTF